MPNMNRIAVRDPPHPGCPMEGGIQKLHFRAKMGLYLVNRAR